MVGWNWWRNSDLIFTPHDNKSKQKPRGFDKGNIITRRKEKINSQIILLLERKKKKKENVSESEPPWLARYEWMSKLFVFHARLCKQPITEMGLDIWSEALLSVIHTTLKTVSPLSSLNQRNNINLMVVMIDVCSTDSFYSPTPPPQSHCCASFLKWRTVMLETIFFFVFSFLVVFSPIFNSSNFQEKGGVWIQSNMENPYYDPTKWRMKEKISICLPKMIQGKFFWFVFDRVSNFEVSACWYL